MPFIHIKSLPFEYDINISEVVKGITRDFSEENNIPLFHVHTTWEYFLAGHYAKGASAPNYHPESSHPVIVDLLTPDFNNTETIEEMLSSLATSISNYCHMDLNRIFINHRSAHSGMVFDDGKVVRW